MIALLCVLAFSDFSLDFEDLGLYRPVQVFQVGEHFLFSSNSEDALVLVDAMGAVIAEYRKSGQGPEELYRSSVMQITEKEVWMFTRKNHFTIFDHQLNFLRTEKAGPFKKRSFSYGYVEGDKTRAFSSFSARSKYLMYEFEKTTRGFRETGRSFLQKEIDSSRITESLVLTHQRGYFFKYAVGVKENYQVDISQGQPRKEQDGDIILSLAADVGEFRPTFPGSNTQAFVNGAYKLDQGFAVSISARTEPVSKTMDLAYFVDYFDDQGGFLRREETEAVLMGCFNCPDVFIVRTHPDGDRVQKLKTALSGSP